MSVADQKTIVRPKFTMGWPQWWHPHGEKMVVVSFPNPVIIGTSASGITITAKGAGYFVVAWEIVHAVNESFVRGQIVVAEAILEAMFGIREYIDPNAQGIIDSYGGSSAYGGHFLRYETFLNIPGPGTGIDGDPNISVRIDEKIRSVVAEFILRARQLKKQPK